MCRLQSLKFRITFQSWRINDLSSILVHSNATKPFRLVVENWNRSQHEFTLTRSNPTRCRQWADQRWDSSDLTFLICHFRKDLVLSSLSKLWPSVPEMTNEKCQMIYDQWLAPHALLRVFDGRFENLVAPLNYSADRWRHSYVRLYSTSLQLTAIGMTYVVSRKTHGQVSR